MRTAPFSMKVVQMAGEWVLWRLGCLLRHQGREKEAAAALDDGLSLARELQQIDLEVLFLCEQARQQDGLVASAIGLYEERREQMPVWDRMRASFQIGEATEDRSYIQEAKRLLDYVVEHAPEEYRESMLQNVRLHREIMGAWEKRGGGS